MLLYVILCYYCFARYAIASDSTGRYLAAVDYNNGYIYTSSDYGVTWTSRTGAGAHHWYEKVLLCCYCINIDYYLVFIYVIVCYFALLFLQQGILSQVIALEAILLLQMVIVDICILHLIME